MTSETIDGIYNKALTRTYATEGLKGRTAGMSIDGTSLYGYDYDTYGRLSKIATAAGDFDYTRLANSDLVSQMTRPNGVTTSWSYEPHRNLITQVANGTVSIFDYVNNAIGNRTAMGRSGSVFTTPDTVNYTYNTRSEVVGALSNALPSYDYSYAYDPIGNRLTAEQAGEDFTYTANNLNQYTQVNTEAPTYDVDGNMLTRDGWTQVWNGENRMIVASKGNQRLEFDYDYMGRRIFKKVYEGETLTMHTRFVYDGYKLIQELDALNGNALLRRYVWQPEAAGLDVPLSVFETIANQAYYYNVDANKNVSDLTDTNGDVVAHCEYSPIGTVFDKSENLFFTNYFRFSSEYYDIETGLACFNYRYYCPRLGRWLTRDPISEMDNWNLYGFARNDVVNFYDSLGLESGSVTITFKYGEYRKILSMSMTDTGFEVRYSAPIPVYKNYKIDYEYEKYCETPTSPVVILTSSSGNLEGLLDQYGFSFQWVGYTKSYFYTQKPQTGARQCPSGYNGATAVHTVTFFLKERTSIGLNPGLGPVSFDIGLSVGKEKDLGSARVVLSMTCCVCAN